MYCSVQGLRFIRDTSSNILHSNGMGRDSVCNNLLISVEVGHSFMEEDVNMFSEEFPKKINSFTSS